MTAGAAIAAALSVCLSIGGLPAVAEARSEIDYVSASPQGVVVLDTRATDVCSKRSLKGARCLPAKDFLADHRRLANISGLLWLLGTVGLEGAEHVLVTGDASADKEFVAGQLHLAGQAKVSVLATPIDRLDSGSFAMAPGTPRSMTREKVYQASMRDDRIILRSELAALIGREPQTVILDGRSDKEYWGSLIRAVRGGHIPGAQSLPLRSLRPKAASTPPVLLSSGVAPVIYGHDAYEGLVYLARLTAMGMTPRLFLGGWASWAANGALPADAESFPDAAAGAAPVLPDKRAGQSVAPSFATWPPLVIAALAGATLASGGIWLAQRNTRS